MNGVASKDRCQFTGQGSLVFNAEGRSGQKLLETFREEAKYEIRKIYMLPSSAKFSFN